MDEITREVKNMYERYPFPSSNIINVAYGNRIKRFLLQRGFNINNLKILDAGCGSGEKVISLAKVFTDSQVTGWDIAETSIQKAIALARQEGVRNINFEGVNLLSLNLDKYKDYFDLIISWGVIHHISDPVKGMKSLGLCLKPSGLMYIWVYALLSLEMQEARLFRDAIKILLKKEEFSYEKGIKVANAVKGLLKRVNYSGWRDVMMRIKWLLDKDVDKRQVILHILKNFRRIKYTTDYDVNIVDSFLHANEKDYDIEMVFKETEEAGLEILDFLDMPKEIERIVESDYVRKLFYDLDLKDRLKVMERLTNPGHHLFVVRRR